MRLRLVVYTARVWELVWYWVTPRIEPPHRSILSMGTWTNSDWCVLDEPLEWPEGPAAEPEEVWTWWSMRNACTLPLSEPETTVLSIMASEVMRPPWLE